MQAWSPVQMSASTPNFSLTTRSPDLIALASRRLHAALLVEHAFGGGDDDLRPLVLRRQRLAQSVAHPADVVGAVDLPHPVRADALDRVDDAVVGLAARIERARGGNVLPAGRGRIKVVDDERHAVVLVEHGVADRGGQAIVPEAAVAEHRDRTLARRHVEGRGRGRAQAVAHRRRADVEGRQDREQMAADVGGDVMRPELLLRPASSRRRSAAPGSRCRSPADAAARPRRAPSRADRTGPARDRAAAGRCRATRGRGATRNSVTPLIITGAVYSPPIGSTSLPETFVWMSRRRRIVLRSRSI